MKKYILLIAIAVFGMACEKMETLEPSVYECNLTFTDNSETHPKKAIFENAILELSKITPGIQVTVQSSDGLIWNGAAGMADLDNNIPLEPCQPFMIGSISKVYTAVLIFQLQDEGILSIDDKLSDWLAADFINEIENANEVTLKQLLNHTSGIKDYLGIEHFVDALNIPNYTLTQREKLEYIYGKAADHAPGAEHTYSNSNYVLLGLVIENARNMRLWEAVDKHIVEPLGLQNTSMGTESNPIPTGTVRPYLASRGNQSYDIMPNAVSDAATGDGGIASNMQDLNAFIHAIFDKTIISDAAFQQMTENLVDVDGYTYPNWEEEFYGYGVEVYDTEFGRAFGHSGSTSAYNAFLLHYPEENVTISAAFNGISYDEEFYTKGIDMLKTMLEAAM